MDSFARNEKSYLYDWNGIEWGCANKGNHGINNGATIVGKYNTFPQGSKCNNSGIDHWDVVNKLLCEGWDLEDYNSAVHDSTPDSSSRCWQWQCKKQDGKKMVFKPGSHAECIDAAAVAAQEAECNKPNDTELRTMSGGQCVAIACKTNDLVLLNGRCVPICGLDSSKKQQAADDTTFVKIGGKL